MDPSLKVKGSSNIFALGDCSYIEDNPLPCTAQVAERQGKSILYNTKEIWMDPPL